MIKHRLPIKTSQEDKDPRYNTLLEWVWGLSDTVAVLEGVRIPPSSLAADASNRRFYRLKTTVGSVILVDAPPDSEANADYLKLSKWYRSHGFLVPEIYAHDLGAGYFVVSDLGEQTYLDVLECEPERADALYETAIATLLRLARLTPDVLPIYDKVRFAAELELFITWFVQAWLAQSPPNSWAQLKADLLAAVLSQPKICTHRDFHSRNLLQAHSGANSAEVPEPGIVDYQDSLQGPLCYDIASLLWDCYIDWHETDSLGRLHDYYAHLPCSLKTKLNSTDFERLTLLTASQRHLKALGIFARLHVQEGRSHYIASMPRVLDYLVLHLRALSPEFSDWLTTDIRPLVMKELSVAGEATTDNDRRN